MDNLMSDKKKKELEELINESENEAREHKKNLLPLGICFLLGGIVSFIAIPFVIQIDGINKRSMGMHAICITFGFIGCLGGPFMFYKYINIKKEE